MGDKRDRGRAPVVAIGVGSWQRAARPDGEVASDTDAAVAWYNLGFTLHEAGDLAGAEEAYRRALALDPDDPHAWFNLGNVLADGERHFDAVEAYRRALALDRDDPEAWNNLGAARCECGVAGLREAIDCFEATLALAPDYHPAWNNLGNAIECLGGDLHRAAAAYRRALTLRDRASYRLNLASALCRLDRPAEGARYLADALAKEPGLRTVLPAFPEFEGLFEA